MVSYPSDHTLALQAAVRLLSKPAWKQLSSNGLFSLRDVTSGNDYYAALLSYCSCGPGLILARGDRGFSVLHGLMCDEIQDDLLSTSCDMFILCTANAFDNTPKWIRAYLRKYLGLVAIKQGNIPVLMSRKAGCPPKAMVIQEARVANRLLEAIYHLVNDLQFELPDYEDDQGIPHFIVRGRKVEEGGMIKPSPVSLLPVAVRLPRQAARPLTRLPRLKRDYCISCTLAPEPVRGQDAIIFLVFDRADKTVVHGDLIPGRDLEAAVKVLVSAFDGGNLEGRTGLPCRLITDSQFCQQGLEHVCDALELPLLYYPDFPELRDLRISYWKSIASLGETDPPIVPTQP